MARRTGKKLSKKARFWDEKIREWQKMNISQSTYCEDRKLSVTAFSKWKKKLHPNIELRHPVYRVRSKYYKFTKLPDEKIEALMKCFLQGMPAKQASEKTGIKQNSIYKFYNDFRLALVEGALSYPQLFFGAGMSLIFGPPPFFYKALKDMSIYFPAHRIINRKGSIRSRKHYADNENGEYDKNNFQVLSNLLLFNTSFIWSLADMSFIRELGFTICYELVLAPYNKIDTKKHKLSDEVLNHLYKTISNFTAARLNWTHWLIHNKAKTLLLPDKTFDIIYSNKERRFIVNNKEWLRQMFLDFKWVLKKNKIGDKVKTRSTYWDDFIPKMEEVRKVMLDLELWPRSNFTITELASLADKRGYKYD